MADRSRSPSPASTEILSRPPTPVPDSRFSSFAILPLPAASTSDDDDDDEAGPSSSTLPTTGAPATTSSSTIGALVLGSRLRQLRKRARSPSVSREEDDDERATKRTRVGDSSSSSTSHSSSTPASNLPEVIDLTNDVDEPTPGTPTGADEHQDAEDTTAFENVKENPAPTPDRHLELLCYECPVCLERVKDVTVLSCAHSVCNTCLHASLDAIAQRMRDNHELPRRRSRRRRALESAKR